jgi:hypothetical protein
MLTRTIMLIIFFWGLITWYVPVEFVQNIKLLRKEYGVEVRKWTKFEVSVILSGQTFLVTKHSTLLFLCEYNVFQIL